MTVYRSPDVKATDTHVTTELSLYNCTSYTLLPQKAICEAATPTESDASVKVRVVVYPSSTVTGEDGIEGEYMVALLQGSRMLTWNATSGT